MALISAKKTSIFVPINLTQCVIMLVLLILWLTPIFLARIKHIKIDYHFVQTYIIKKHLRVAFTSKNYQLVVVLTKPFPKFEVSCSRSTLNMVLMTRFLQGIKNILVLVNQESNKANELTRKTNEVASISKRTHNHASKTQKIGNARP